MGWETWPSASTSYWVSDIGRIIYPGVRFSGENVHLYYPPPIIYWVSDVGLHGLQRGWAVARRQKVGRQAGGRHKRWPGAGGYDAGRVCVVGGGVQEADPTPCRQPGTVSTPFCLHGMGHVLGCSEEGQAQKVSPRAGGGTERGRAQEYPGCGKGGGRRSRQVNLVWANWAANWCLCQAYHVRWRECRGRELGTALGSSLNCSAELLANAPGPRCRGHGRVMS